MEKVNIVVLSEDLDLRIQIKNLVQSDEFAISGYGNFDSEGTLKTQNLFPDIVICAIKGDVPQKVFDFVQQMLINIHDCVAVLVNDNITVELVNKAAQFGMRHVIPYENISPEDFVKTVKDVYKLELQRVVDTNEGKKVRSKVISIFGGKGGTGKTTVAVNTAAALAKMGKRVMLVDFDLQFGDVALALDLDPKNSIVDLVQDRGGITIENIRSFSVDHSSGMSILSAPKSPEFAEFVKQQHVEKIIDVMRPFYEYIILDLPATFSDIVITACENSEEIFLVYNPEILSLRNAKVCISILDQLQQREKIKIVLNENDKGLISSKDYEEMLRLPVFATFPMDTKTALSSVNKGLPITVSQPRSALSASFVQFAETIVSIHTGITVISADNSKKKKLKKDKKKLKA